MAHPVALKLTIAGCGIVAFAYALPLSRLTFLGLPSLGGKSIGFLKDYGTENGSPMTPAGSLCCTVPK